MSFGEVKDTLDRVNSQPGNLDEINMPTKCESCQVFLRDFEVKAMEIPLKLTEGTAEATFLELYENFCDKMMSYKVHMDKKGLSRFQLEQSQFLKNLQKMKKGGTEIKTDVPIDLWDQPTIEAERLRLDCEVLSERFEEQLEDWFINKRGSKRGLVEWLCVQEAKNPPCTTRDVNLGHQEL